MIDTAPSPSPFSLPVRVYIEDTDAGGIVFHAKYLHYMERESDGVLLADAVVKVACVALDTGRPRVLPETMKALMPTA